MWGLDGVRTSGNAKLGAGSACINLSEERYKHREWLIGQSDGSQEENMFFSKLAICQFKRKTHFVLNF